VFEREYMARYQAIVAAFRQRDEGGGPVEIAAQVLSSAVEGVIHNAARRGMLQSPELRQELVLLVSAYLGRGTQAVTGLVVCVPNANTAS
jgi:hypothetical protein